MGNQPATTAPIPQYPPNPGPISYQGPPGPQEGQAAYYRSPPQQFVDAAYGPPPGAGRYGPPPPRAGRFGPPPPNGPPPVRLGDRHYGGPSGGGRPGPSGPPSGLQPRDNYPPNLRRILDDDDDDIFADDADVFRNKPRRGPDFGGGNVEDFVFAKMNKNGIPPERGHPSGGGVQASREPQYRAKPQIVHIQPQGNEQYPLNWDHQNGRLIFEPKPGISEIDGYRVDTFNLPPVFEYPGGQGPQFQGFPNQRGSAVSVPGMPQVISGPYGGSSGPYGGSSGPILIPPY